MDGSTRQINSGSGIILGPLRYGRVSHPVLPLRALVRGSFLLSFIIFSWACSTGDPGRASLEESLSSALSALAPDDASLVRSHYGGCDPAKPNPDCFVANLWWPDVDYRHRVALVEATVAREKWDVVQVNDNSGGTIFFLQRADFTAFVSILIDSSIEKCSSTVDTLFSESQTVVCWDVVQVYAPD